MKQIFFLLLLGAVIGYFVTAHNDLVLAQIQKYSPVKIPLIEKSVEGASTKALPQGVQQALTNLPVADIATASPQLQSLIHVLQKMPKGQIKMVCENVCNGIK